MEGAWEKLPVLEGRGNPCLCCPPIPSQACQTKLIAVGFGAAYVTRDDDIVLDGENAEEWVRFADAEKMASADPDHDWRVVLHGPMHGETYQRQGEGQWMLVEKNEGFA